MTRRSTLTNRDAGDDLDAAQPLEGEHGLRARAIADGEAPRGAEPPGHAAEGVERVVPFRDHDELARHLGNVEDRLHAREEEDRVAAWAEERAGDPVVCLGGLTEARQPALEPGQVLEVRGGRQEEQADAVRREELVEPAPPLRVVEHAAVQPSGHRPILAQGSGRSPRRYSRPREHRCSGRPRRDGAPCRGQAPGHRPPRPRLEPDPERAAELVERGASASDSPAAAARDAEAVLTMVATPDALQSVTEGPSGIASGAGPATTVIELSTVGPAAVLGLEEALPEGTGLLDAPVLGSVTEAESGTLTVFVGGPAQLVERWTPLLSALGTPIHVGPLGAGAAAKLVANSTLFGVIGALGEAVALADGLGLEREVAFDVLSRTPLAAQAERRRASIETGEYPARFALSLARKDADLLLEAAAREGVDLRLAEAARTWLADAEEAGRGGEDYSAVLGRILGDRP